MRLLISIIVFGSPYEDPSSIFYLILAILLPFPYIVQGYAFLIKGEVPLVLTKEGLFVYDTLFLKTKFIDYDDVIRIQIIRGNIRVYYWNSSKRERLASAFSCVNFDSDEFCDMVEDFFSDKNKTIYP